MIGRGHVGTREITANKLTCTAIYLFVGGLIFVALLPHISVVLVSLTPDASQWRLSISALQLYNRALPYSLHT